MKLSCNIIQDILPLVVEDLASEDTVKLINDHIETCPKCNEEYMELKASKISYKAINKPETVPLKSINRKLKNKNIYIGLLSALIICLSLVIAVNIVTKPIPLSYMEAIESTKVENEKLFIEFKPRVSNYSIVSYESSHDVMAWKTIASKFFDSGEPKNTVINIDDEKSTIVNYISQGGEQDKLLYGKVDYKGQVSLPRLAMNFYLKAMTFVFIIAIFLSLVFKNIDKIKKILKIIIISTLSYILGHISIFGVGGPTYHIVRDFYFVIGACILFFSIIILLIYKEFFLNIRGNIDKLYNK